VDFKSTALPVEASPPCSASTAIYDTPARGSLGCNAASPKFRRSSDAGIQFSTTPLTLLSEPSGLPPITLSNIDPLYYGPGFKGAIGAGAVARQ
jgi:hypothetical protein